MNTSWTSTTAGSLVLFLNVSVGNMIQQSIAVGAATLVWLSAMPGHAYRLEAANASRLEATQAVFGGPNATILRNPADWSRDVYPIPVHSHNDYWRDVPILDALAYGVRSMESDVWLNPDDKQLYVGHDPFSLSQERTFQNLTLAPLKAAIDQANAANALRPQDRETANFFANLQKQQAPTVNESAPFSGYFSAGIGLTAPIQLLIDIKTDGITTFPYVLDALRPLAEAGYLTTYDSQSNKTIPGPLYMIGTGNTPLAQLQALPSPRFIFFDCPLGKLNASHDAQTCGIASTNLASLTPTWLGLGDPTPDQQRNLTIAINDAHAKGIKTRIWDTPNWPAYARDTINKYLLNIGSDWINADDLEQVAYSF